METQLLQDDFDPAGRKKGYRKAEWKTKEEVPLLFKNAYENIKLLWEKANL